MYEAPPPSEELPKIIGTNRKNHKCSKLPDMKRKFVNVRFWILYPTPNGDKIYQNEILLFLQPPHRNQKFSNYVKKICQNEILKIVHPSKLLVQRIKIKKQVKTE